MLCTYSVGNSALYVESVTFYTFVVRKCTYRVCSDRDSGWVACAVPSMMIWAMRLSVMRRPAGKGGSEPCKGGDSNDELHCVNVLIEMNSDEGSCKVLPY